MSKRTIKKGKHDWKPIDGIGILPWFWLKDRALVCEFEFTASCFYDTTNWLLDAGSNTALRHQWNKLPGMSLRFFNKDVDAVMGAWRGSGEHIELTAYANRDGEKIVGWDETPQVDQVFLRVNPGDRPILIIYPVGKQMYVVRWVKGRDEKHYAQQALIKFPDRSPSVLSPIGLWFGGTQPAPHNMEMKMSKWWLKKERLRQAGLII